MKLNEQFDYENLYHCNNEGTGQFIAYNFFYSSGQFSGYYGTLLDYCESFPAGAWAENEWGANYTAHYCESFNESGYSVPGGNTSFQGDGGNTCACLEMEASIQNGVTPNPTFNDMTQFIAYCENGGPTAEPEEEETDVPERPRPPRPDGEKKEQWACKSGVSEFCVEITQDMLLPQGVTIADLQMNAFDSYETCVANSPCKKGREGAINESVIKRFQKLAGIKK